MTSQKAKLILKNGKSFEGFLSGSDSPVSGEVVFATGMTGYPEALTDPSFHGQIVVFTYPLIGNYGVPTDEISGTDNIASKVFESHKIHSSGVIVSEICDEIDHANARKSFSDWLKTENVPCLTGVDTRSLTKELRDNGTMLGKIITNRGSSEWRDPNSENIVPRVTCKSAYTVPAISQKGSKIKKVMLIDCGVKHNIINELTSRGVDVRVVPWDYDVSQETFDGLVISNGPGDPAKCDATIRNIRSVFPLRKPIFGICLGNQLLAHAAGGTTLKLPYGHRSQNQPCVDLTSGRVYITTQNHGFHVKEDSLPKDWEPWFRNVNDASNEGIRHKTLPFRSVQFHPEARPGPTDTKWLFDEFISQL